MEPLTGRQHSILLQVVDTYIETAQPVGSRTVTEAYRERYQGFFSPATVRFEMGVLEEKGYLEHPHTSAGRVPTDQGYRYYVDHSRMDIPLPPICEQLLEEFEDLIRLPDREKLVRSLEVMCQKFAKACEELALLCFSSTFTSSFFKPISERLYLSGVSYLLRQPEFLQNLDFLEGLFKFIEDKDTFMDYLYKKFQCNDALWVGIGGENDLDVLKNFSIVLYPLTVQGKKVGGIVVIGPRRICYNQILSFVEKFSNRFNFLLERMAYVYS